MQVKEDWPEYVRRLTRGQKQSEVAQRTGVSISNVGRWQRGELVAQPDAENVIAFARAYGQSPIEALTAAGYLRQGELQTDKTPLSQYTMAELIDELRRRTVD